MPLWARAPCGLGLAGAWRLVGRFLRSCWLEDWGRLWSEPGKLPQVLCCGGEQELIVCPTWSTQPQPAELEDAFKMRKQHLDPFAISAGLLECGRARERSCDIAGILVDVARDLAMRCSWAASRLVRTQVTVGLL